MFAILFRWLMECSHQFYGPRQPEDEEQRQEDAGRMASGADPAPSRMVSMKKMASKEVVKRKIPTSGGEPRKKQKEVTEMNTEVTEQLSTTIKSQPRKGKAAKVKKTQDTTSPLTSNRSVSRKVPGKISRAFKKMTPIKSKSHESPGEALSAEHNSAAPKRFGGLRKFASKVVGGSQRRKAKARKDMSNSARERRTFINTEETVGTTVDVGPERQIDILEEFKDMECTDRLPVPPQLLSEMGKPENIHRQMSNEHFKLLGSKDPALDITTGSKEHGGFQGWNDAHPSAPARSPAIKGGS